MGGDKLDGIQPERGIDSLRQQIKQVEGVIRALKKSGNDNNDAFSIIQVQEQKLAALKAERDGQLPFDELLKAARSKHSFSQKSLEEAQEEFDRAE